MPQTAEYEFVSSAPSQDQSNIIEVDSDPLQLEEEDSISGIDKGMHKMDVLLSSKSPVLDNSFDVFMEGQQKVRVQPDSNLNTICEEEPDTVHQLQFLMSSQGSEEGAQDENENEIDQIRKEFMQQRQLLCEAKHTLKSTTISCGSKTNVNDEIRNGNAAFSSDCALSKAAEAISGTYDRSLNLGNRYVSESVQDATENSSSFVEPKNPGSSLVIIFSNLFDWSALKVNDKVEIHEPCRKIAIPGLSMVAYGSAVWIAERYKVISNQR
ncbi:hypothetical protein BCR41DRAFT_162723 [Lobosporangium transversale]|uniref:Uncharacterized protein n=1 Tax=Lobosporangium transversale TaxID=64571 RepID=A0A1Y2GE76_9FUNG|nr:hypothetical protein BCR41DRAFT_162723 [Lobosporangium transversale]ORZ07299.1 hypothetical protein BCR41DRAFT_162723 [Lobosporangium transversale]|eukprot:XP_021877962.1 hypothetical protein BCR41DRAFT_162723 [Lobosporangium transversale]